MHNEEDQGRKSIITKDMVHQVDQFIQENRRFTNLEPSTKFFRNFSQYSRQNHD